MTFLFTGVAFATNTRVMTMGNVNNIVKDDANIWLYPSTLVYYGGQVVCEVGDYYGFHQMGGTWNVGNGVLGAFFSTVPYEHYIIPYSFDEADHRIDLFYAQEVSGTPVGFRFGLYGSGSKDEGEDIADNYNYSVKRMEFAFGASPGNWDISAFYAKSSWTHEETEMGSTGADTNGYTWEPDQPKSNTDFGVDARYWMNPWPDWWVIPHFSWGTFKSGVEAYELSGSGTTEDPFDNWLYWEDDWKETGFDIGIGTNFNVTPDVMTVTDMGVYLYKAKSDYVEHTDPDVLESDPDYPATWTCTEEVSYKAMPYFKIGLDAVVCSWLDVRCGVNSYWSKAHYKDTLEDWPPPYPYDPDDDDWTDTYVDTDMYLGAGITWGDLVIDACVDPWFLLNGPYFVSGNQTGYEYEGGLAGQVSVLYPFDID